MAAAETARPRPVHLNRYFHFTQLMRDPAIGCEVRRYQSGHDGTMQSVVVLRPADREPAAVHLFCHGMDGDPGDAVVVRDLVARTNAMVVAPGGRGPAWLSSAFVADTTALVEQHCAGADRFFLTGISMGATQALALAALLPSALTRSLRGVIALLPAADLHDAAYRSPNPRVRQSLLDSAGGTGDALRARSPDHLVERYPARLPFAVMWAEEDTLFPAAATARFVERLRRRGHPVSAYVVPGSHEFVYLDFDYAAVVASLGKDRDRAGPAPTIASDAAANVGIALP